MEATVSRDFPKRSKWLAVRETNRKAIKRRGRVIWDRGTYVRALHGPIGEELRRLLLNR